MSRFAAASIPPLTDASDQKRSSLKSRLLTKIRLQSDQCLGSALRRIACRNWQTLAVAVARNFVVAALHLRRDTRDRDIDDVASLQREARNSQERLRHCAATSLRPHRWYR